MNIISSIVRSEPPVFGGRALDVRRSPRARAMRLAVDPRDGAVRLTLPGRAALREGHRWAESKRGWIEAQLATIAPRIVLAPGAAFPFEGRAVTIAWAPTASRTPRLVGDRLLVGGPEALVGGRILRWLKAEAKRRLEAETRAIAAVAGLLVDRVSVGDPKSRWGSCSAAGAIRYSWRLVLAPPEVRRATVAHEVAHRRHMHHGPAFHACVAELFGRAPKAESAWLKTHGASLWAVTDDTSSRSP